MFGSILALKDTHEVNPLIENIGTQTPPQSLGHQCISPSFIHAEQFTTLSFSCRPKL